MESGDKEEVRRTLRGDLGRAAISIVIGILCLWLSLRGIDLDQVRSALGRMSPGWLAGAVGAVVLVALMKGVRWWYLYPAHRRPPSWKRTFPTLMTAQMLNVLIPVRLGELARIGLMAQDDAAPGVTLSTIVVEKSLDLFSVGFLLLLVGAPVSILPEWFPAQSGMQMGISGAVLLVGLMVLWRVRGWLKARIVSGLGFGGLLPDAWRERLTKLASDLLDGLGALTGLRTALPVFGFTAAIWLASILTMYFMLEAFGLMSSWYVALMLSLAIYLSNLVPTPPALVGVIGAVTVLTLGWFGVPRSDAAALGLILNIILVAPLVLMGGIAAWMRFANLTQGKWRERWAWSLGLSRKEP